MGLERYLLDCGQGVRYAARTVTSGPRVGSVRPGGRQLQDVFVVVGDDEKSASGQAQRGWQFTTTHWSVIVTAGNHDGEAAMLALEKLCRTYWYPLFAYVRRRGHTEDQARDLTQAFFAQLIAGRYVADAKRERGRFRTFMLSSLDHFLANEWNRAQALKRGGGITFVSLEFAREQEAHQIEPVDEMTPELHFERRWAEAVLTRTLSRVQDEFDGAKVKRFEHLKRFLTEGKGTESYAEAAGALGMSEAAVKSAIHRLRQRFRELLREEIAQTVVTTSEIDGEIRHLLEVLA